jgi:hypothetical protein
VALEIIRRPKATPVHELERYMRCRDCSQVQGYVHSLVSISANGLFRADMRWIGRATRRASMARRKGSPNEQEAVFGREALRHHGYTGHAFEQVAPR